MMQNTVANSRFMNVTLFRIVDVKAVIRTMTVGFVFQIPMKLKKVFLKMSLKFRYVRFVAFIRFECLPSLKEIFWGNNSIEKVAISFHGK